MNHKLNNHLKPYTSKLGITADKLLMEFARFTNLRQVGIYTIAQAIFENRPPIESENLLSGNTPGTVNSKLSYNDMRKWLGICYGKIKPIDKTKGELSRQYVMKPTDCELIISDYTINTKSLNASLLIGYERHTSTVLTMIYKMSETESPTFGQNAFYGFIKDAIKTFSEKLGKPDVSVKIILMADDQSKNIDFIDIEKIYNHVPDGNLKVSAKITAQEKTKKEDVFTPELGQRKPHTFKKTDVLIEIARPSYKKDNIELFMDEDIPIDELRIRVSKYATRINKSIKSMEKRPKQDVWVGQFIKNIEWKVIGRR